MSGCKCSFISRLLIIFTIVLIWWGIGLAAPPFQPTPIILKAGDLLPASLIKGDNYTIADTVRNDGVINTYQLNTSYGILFVESTAELRVRINELNALKGMEEMERKGVFKDSLVSGVKAPVKLVGDLVTSPVQTTKNIGKGTGSFISNAGRSIFSRDPHQDNIMKVALGYDVTKRQFAYNFLINPYTPYKPVSERLGEISRAAVAGGLLPRVAMAAISGPVGTALSLSTTAKGMKKLVRDNPPGALRKINDKKLVAMGVDPTLIKVFLNNHSFDPETSTILVGELETMDGVKGLEYFIAAASLANDATTALLYQVTAQMVADYHHKVAPVTEVGEVSGRPYLINNAGLFVLPVPVDYVFWTWEVAEKLNAVESGIQKSGKITGKTLWVSGKVEQRAREMIAARGWQIMQDASDKLIK